MSTLLKATARLTGLGAKLGSILHTLADNLHSATLDLHDAAFTAKRHALAQKQAGLLKAQGDARDRHFNNVERLYNEFTAAVAKAQAEYDAALDKANKSADISFRSVQAELKSVGEEIIHYREQHALFRS